MTILEILILIGFLSYCVSIYLMVLFDVYRAPWLYRKPISCYVVRVGIGKFSKRPYAIVARDVSYKGKVGTIMTRHNLTAAQYSNVYCGCALEYDDEFSKPVFVKESKH